VRLLLPIQQAAKVQGRKQHKTQWPHAPSLFQRKEVDSLVEGTETLGSTGILAGMQHQYIGMPWRQWPKLGFRQIISVLDIGIVMKQKNSLFPINVFVYIGVGLTWAKERSHLQTNCIQNLLL